jgi:hypothetical protein
VSRKLGLRKSGRLRRLARPLNDALARRFGVRLTSDVPGVRINAEWIQRLLYFDRLLEQVRDVEGDVVECGVAGGQSLAMLASLLRERGQNRRIWGFDSWAGLPSPSAADLESDESRAASRMFAWASPSVVRAEFRAHGLDPAAVELIRGSFDETLPGYTGTIALLHVDADLYESYRVTLSELWPRLAVGGIVAFDEYDDSAAWPGARRAVDEFLHDLPTGSAELRRDGTAGKSFAVKLG